MKKAYLKTVQTEIVNSIDKETGELMDTSVKKMQVIVKDKEEFFFVYSHILGILDGTTSGPEMSVIAVIMFKYLTNSGFFAFTKADKEDIAKICNISISSVEKSIKSLVARDTLKRQSRGGYTINPNYIWKGSTSTRNERMKLDLMIVTEKAESFL